MLEVLMVTIDPDDAVREEQIQRILKQVEAKLRKDLKRGVRPLHEIEFEVEEIGESIKETITKEIVDECGSGYIGSRTLCVCGCRSRYAGMRSRQMITLHGVVSITRAYYSCGSCKSGFCPLDHDLALSRNQCSRSVQSLIARFCSYLPFATATKELEIVCGIALSPTTVQHYARQIGRRIEEEWEHREQLLVSKRAPKSGQRPKRLHASMDGAFAHIGGDWREVKLAAIYQRSQKGAVHSTRYYGTIDNSKAFGPKVWTLAHYCGADCCADVQVVADGAPWIWQETGKYFPTSVQTLDYYHAAQHLHEAANARYGEGTQQSKEWINHLKGLLLEDQIDAVGQQIEDWKPRRPKSRTIKKRLVDFLKTHRHRMKYKTLKEQGYHIGSGVMEAGCKSVVKARMAGTGMRWEQPGAQAIIHLCAHWRSHGSASFQEFTN
jgi:hypothetical protein